MRIIFVRDLEVPTMHICHIHVVIPIETDFTILTDFHPCNGRTCPFYGVCKAPTKTTHECVCVPCTTEESAPLCDNNDVTHKNKCEYNYHVCLAQEEPGIKHYGGCKRESFLIYVAEFLNYRVKYQEIKKV